MLKTVIIGSGNWETAFAQMPVDNTREAVLWGKNSREIDDTNLWYQNTRFFPDVTLHESLRATYDLNVVRDADPLVLSAPTIAVEELCIKIGALVKKPVIVVNTPKGFYPQTNERMSNVIRRFMLRGKLKSVVSLTGPSHAEGVVLRVLTAVRAVSLCEEDACSVQKLFSNEYLRVHRGDDEIGSEVDIALKNVIAVTSGVLSGVGYGDNTKTVLITRGLAEVIHCGVALDGRAEAFMGLTNIGDLTITRTSIHSHSFQAGYEIGAHNSAHYFWENDIKTVEGVRTARVAYRVAKQKQIGMSIVEEIYRVLYRDRKPQQSTRDLVLCDLKHEME